MWLGMPSEHRHTVILEAAIMDILRKQLHCLGGEWISPGPDGDAGNRSGVGGIGMRAAGQQMFPG